MNHPLDPRATQRVRHDIRFRQLTVSEVLRLTPNMIRIALRGPELEGFASLGFDDHVKLVFPDADSGELRRPVPGPDGPVWPQGRPEMRDYTPRRYDPATQTLTIDFAVHDAGPATRWALQARPGDTLGVGGPRGSMIIPTAFDAYVLIGDDTALPAIGRRLEELPQGAPVLVLAEVETPEDQQVFDTRADLRTSWVHRRGGAAGTTDLLLPALDALTMPPGDCHCWIACESGVAKALRERLISAHGARPQWTKAAGYWKRGAEATHERHDGAPGR